MGKYRITSLKKFCMSVENINDSTFKLIKSLFEKIFADTLGACFFQVLRGGHRIQPSGTAALLTIWSSEKSEHKTLEIHTRSELYGGLAQLAFLLDKPFWLTASDQRLLLDTAGSNAQAHLVDSWSKVDEIIGSWPHGPKLPDYMDYGGGDAKTAIIIPLKYSGHVFGILNLEFKEHLAFARKSKVKLDDIADSIARVIWLRETTESSEEDTHAALEILEDNFDFKCSPCST